MSKAQIEHVNITVADAEATADRLCRMFGWQVRWQGASQHGGRSVHVGNDFDYLAVYTPPKGLEATDAGTSAGATLNHIGIVVEDLDAAEARVRAEGFEPFGHDDYEPGRRFYFGDENGIEFEVVSYA